MYDTLQGCWQGKSHNRHLVHNQRVERLWRDVYIASTSLFYQLFYMLEEVGLLDPENEIHLYALHYVYLPRINQSLQLFCNSWNQHPLTSCNCRTPQQLWLRGMLQNIHSGYTAVDSLSSSIVLPTPTPTESDVETPSVIPRCRKLTIYD